ncbi:MAG: hypothetical protein AB7O52_05680 [Planctomycetota bacterium]
MNWSKRIPFQVDVAGIIEIMGRSLYSRPDTPIRELIQNAHDGIQRRRREDLSYEGQIRIQQQAEAGTLSFEDDGIGLSAAEAEKYLGTLGLGVTGLLRHGACNGRGDPTLIGQFGVGFVSSFLLAERIRVETRRATGDEPVTWEAGGDTDILLSAGSREPPGTRVTLFLKPEFHRFCDDPRLLEETVRSYADFLPIPVFINEGIVRVNVGGALWLEPTVDPERLELELESTFDETPLDVIPIHAEHPVPVRGALYVTPQRTPGFGDRATATVTVRRMVISRSILDLLPPWASFVRGILELPHASPTASREDLVRDETFRSTRETLSVRLYEHLERLANDDPPRLRAILSWHRYTFAGSAIEELRLRKILSRAYRFPTTHGVLTFDEILERSTADPLHELEVDSVVWFASDPRMEASIARIFQGREAPCVHTFRTFEEALLAALCADATEAGNATDLRAAHPDSSGFAEQILKAEDHEPLDAEWERFLSPLGARPTAASFDARQPVLVFVHERHQVRRELEQLHADGRIPSGFGRLMNRHFQQQPEGSHEVLLNRSHRLVARILSERPSNALAPLLRVLVASALHDSRVRLSDAAHRLQQTDLEQLAEIL